MIQSTSNLNGYNRTDPSSHLSAKPAANAKIDADNGERLSSSNTQALQEALKSSPEIRPEVVERGKLLAVDGSYPPRAIIESLSKLFVQAREPAE